MTPVELAHAALEKAKFDLIFRPLLNVDGPPEIWEVGRPQFFHRGGDPSLRVMVECKRTIQGRRMFRYTMEGRS